MEHAVRKLHLEPAPTKWQVQAVDISARSTSPFCTLQILGDVNLREFYNDGAKVPPFSTQTNQQCRSPMLPSPQQRCFAGRHNDCDAQPSKPLRQ